MDLQEELQLDLSLMDFQHEALLGIVHTANLLTATATALLRRYGLTTAQFNVLLALRYKSRPLTQTDLGKRLLVTRASVTSLLDKLETKGLVARNEVSGNRRSHHVELTPNGLTLVEKVEPLYRETVGRITEPLNESECRRLSQQLQDLRHRLRTVQQGL